MPEESKTASSVIARAQQLISHDTGIPQKDNSAGEAKKGEEASGAGSAFAGALRQLQGGEVVDGGEKQKVVHEKQEKSGEDTKKPEPGTQQGEKKSSPDGSSNDDASDDDISDLLKIDPAGLKSKAGMPVSQASRESFSRLQKTLKTQYERAQKLENELKEFKAKPPQASEEVEALKKEVEEARKLKKEFELANFEKTEEWKNTFETPIQQESTKINKAIEGVVKSLDDKQKVVLSSLIREAQEIIGDTEQELVFDSIVDKITDEFITGTAGTKFAKAMQEIFSLTAKRNEAYKDKDKARQEINSRYQQRADKGVEALAERLNLEASAFEKTTRGQILAGEHGKKVGYDPKLVTTAVDEVKTFFATGTITPRLTQILHRGALAEVNDKEVEMLSTTLLKTLDGYKAMEKKIEEYENRISELRGEGRDTKPSDVKTEAKKGFQPGQKYESPLAKKLEKMRAGV